MVKKPMHLKTDDSTEQSIDLVGSEPEEEEFPPAPIRKYSRSGSPRFRHKRGYRRIIAASNRLPIVINPDGSTKKTCGGLASAMEGAAKGHDLLWVGWPGVADCDVDTTEHITQLLRDQYNYVPVFMKQEEVDDFYTGFSNRSLWPLLHYMPTNARFEEKWYQAYVTINMKYAERIVEIAGPDDLVWIHDYHLFLVPGMVKERRPDLRVGFFLHTPFPSYEIIRCNPHARDLMQGLLGADLIGFHTFGYLRHFRSSVLRLNGAQSEFAYIDNDGHRTRIGVYPIGINWDGFKACLEKPSFPEILRGYQEDFLGKKVVVSVERLDYTKGVPQKLQAIEKYLESNAPRVDTKFIIIAVPSRQDVDEYQKLEKEVHLEVSRINGRFSTLSEVPIHYIHRGVELEKLAALYALADVCLVTPLVDGMNLVAKEFIACKDFSLEGVKPGVLVLSEFAGAAQELFNAILVNPHDLNGVARAIEEAMRTPESQSRAYSESMRNKIIQFNSTNWAETILKELSKDFDQEGLGQSISLPMSLTTRFHESSVKKALFLDYDGTLCDFVPNPSKAVPSARLLKILGTLEARSDVQVTIISGRDGGFLSEHFSKFPSFNLVAEHGYRIKKYDSSEWKFLNPHVDLTWMEDVKPILDLYATMTPGAHVEVKKSSIVWHYRSTDPEFGSWKAAELINELSASVQNMPVKVQHGKKIVEVASIQVNKGIAVSHLLEEDFFEEILIAGDDLTDEEMFQIAPEGSVTVKVGRGESKARYRTQTSSSFMNFLENICF